VGFFLSQNKNLLKNFHTSVKKKKLGGSCHWGNTNCTRFFQFFVQIEMTVEWPGSQKLKRISQKIFRQKSFKNRKFQLSPQKKRQLADFLNKICQLF